MLTRSREQVRPAPNTRLALNGKLAPSFALLLLASTQLMGCSVVKGIFKAGVWAGVLGVFVVIGLVAFGISKLGRRA